MSYTEATWPKDRWPNFAHRELACSETGECEMDEAFMDRLQLLRNHYGHALRITSGYRSPAHSIEAAKPAPFGTHCQGPRRGHRSRERRFLHLDDLAPGEYSVPRPSIWSY